MLLTVVALFLLVSSCKSLIVTKDRSLSAQWEHTVLVTPTGYEVLTMSAGSPPTPAFVNAPAAAAV